ncbi:hypothetical protein NSERKGN1266_26940 [Nocardia seriolae]|nr:hypothetical protein NSERKGN1266_26940 [Nocardia seriolae]
MLDDTELEGFDRARLRHHGDVEARAGMVDFAVNVQGSAPPEWVRERLAGRLGELGRYPGRGTSGGLGRLLRAGMGGRSKRCCCWPGLRRGSRCCLGWGRSSRR